jgi:hypothetical protein
LSDLLWSFEIKRDKERERERERERRDKLLWESRERGKKSGDR